MSSPTSVVKSKDANEVDDEPTDRDDHEAIVLHFWRLKRSLRVTEQRKIQGKGNGRRKKQKLQESKQYI